MPVFNQSRSNIIRLIFGGMFLVITVTFNLQVFSDKYKKMAEETHSFPREYIRPEVSFTTITSAHSQQHHFVRPDDYTVPG
jgi:hypothetical protein